MRELVLGGLYPGELVSDLQEALVGLGALLLSN